MNLKVYIETYGCQMNVADSEIVAEILAINNFEIVSDINITDVVIINTCSVRDNAERKIRNRLNFIKGLKKRNLSLKVGIIGCMAQRLGSEFFKNPIVDFVAGPDNYRAIPRLIRLSDNNNKISCTDFNIEENYSGILQKKSPDNSISGYISITRGCNNFCSYCIVPFTRGRERSADYNDIINEVKHLSKNGFKEIILLGQNVNSYFFDDGHFKTDFPVLLEMVANTVPDMRIRFTTSHPKDISDTLIDVMARNKNICNHIHLPVQSGSNRILERMNRKYTREWYLDRIDTIKTKIPDVGLSSDIFCGFSGESEDDFQQTLNLMETVCFDMAFMFKYSERPCTLASKNLIDDVPEHLKKERLNRMIHLQNKISLIKNIADIGKTFEVLTEGISKRSKEMVFGRTKQNKVVVFPAENTKPKDTVIVKITDVTSATLKGVKINP